MDTSIAMGTAPAGQDCNGGAADAVGTRLATAQAEAP